MPANSLARCHSNPTTRTPPANRDSRPAQMFEPPATFAGTTPKPTGDAFVRVRLPSIQRSREHPPGAIQASLESRANSQDAQPAGASARPLQRRWNHALQPISRANPSTPPSAKPDDNNPKKQERFRRRECIRHEAPNHSSPQPFRARERRSE